MDDFEEKLNLLDKEKLIEFLNNLTKPCYETELLLGLQVDVIPLSVLPQVKDKEFVMNIQREAIAL